MMISPLDAKCLKLCMLVLTLHHGTGHRCTQLCRPQYFNYFFLANPKIHSSAVSTLPDVSLCMCRFSLLVFPSLAHYLPNLDLFKKSKSKDFFFLCEVFYSFMQQKQKLFPVCLQHVNITSMSLCSLNFLYVLLSEFLSRLCETFKPDIH